MIISISSDAEDDLIDGYLFYERQHPGLGAYFRSRLVAGIESLAFYAGIHEVVFGFHPLLSKLFPFCIYYVLSGNSVLVVAVLEARQPLELAGVEIGQLAGGFDVGQGTVTRGGHGPHQVLVEVVPQAEGTGADAALGEALVGLAVGEQQHPVHGNGIEVLGHLGGTGAPAFEQRRAAAAVDRVDRGDAGLPLPAGCGTQADQTMLIWLRELKPLLKL